MAVRRRLRALAWALCVLTVVTLVAAVVLAIADPANPGSMVAVGQQSSQGIELAFGLRPVKPVRIQGNLALVRAQFDDFNEKVGNLSVSRAGKRPARRPR